METISKLSTGVYNWMKKDDNIMDSIKQLSDNQILNIANDINSLFAETNLSETKPELTLPRLVVVGTQSSGKSSVLNGIMSMDFLPTGKTMTTRCPLDIRLHKLSSSYKEGWVEFGRYNDSDGMWESSGKISIDVPLPKQSQIDEIRDKIKEQQNELAGTGMDISHKPIVINVHSPFVPNLSLIDLPGLTMVAQTDKGQPKDIKEKIERLVTNYIKQKRTIIIAVMQARADMETDLGLALIKKHDNTGKRTIGVLTKPDLMNSEEHVGNYLNNNISKNLMLSYGYYVIRNRSNHEMKTADIVKGFDLEKNYFISHKEYSKQLYKDRIGMKNLTNDLSKILVTSVTEMIPSVMTEISALEDKINKKLNNMGEELPESKEGKISVLNKYVSNFSSKFVDSIDSRGMTLNTGKRIKDTFIEYKGKLLNLRPFNDHNVYNKQYFSNVISSFEGNHMSFLIPPVQVLEACIKDDNLRPIFKLKEPSIECVDDICDTLIELIRNLSKHDEFIQYPQLAKHILTIVVENIITETKKITKQKVIDALSNEESYIWTDSQEFRKILLDSKLEKLDDIKNIVVMLECYYSDIKRIIAHSIPKIIMCNIVEQIKTVMLSYLIQNVVSEDKIHLLKQDEQIEKQRKYYIDLRGRIGSIKKTFSNNLN